MGGVDTASWKYSRCDLEAFIFQVSLHLVEDQSSIPVKDSRNILAHDRVGASLANDSQHLRPEVAVVVLAESLPG